MAQKSLPFLSTSNESRSRSNSSLRISSLQHSNSVSHVKESRVPTDVESLVKVPTYYSDSEAIVHSNTTSHVAPNPSETNWANKYEDFAIGKPIGFGSSAVVFEAIYKPLNKKVAVKMIDLDMFERNQIDELRRETSLMALSKHPNVLKVYGSFVNGSKLYIVTPYLAAGSCLDIMKTSYPEGFDEISIATILKQALEGLIYLHKNSHIHRDVKAGNLFMDDEGTVLLADFGVSSSLTENGDLRKTFVGTPCWMAPEVMEQAGYDYKADIWSFGITALELATGHAPFAKYPPMKVLMMTLSNAPPTLDRENTKYKYSKMLKDMIDSCLQKDPSKRPSADKLIQHPFFKQAKKKDYLIKSILSHVPPLDQRPTKKIPSKHISIMNTEQWDFDSPDDVAGDKNHINYLHANMTGDPPESSAIEKSKPVVCFEECPKPNHDRSKPVIQPSAEPNDAPPRKHISFGEVIIKDPPPRRTVAGPVVETQAIAESLTPSTGVNTPTKKSRFVISDNAIPSQPVPSSSGSEAQTPISGSPCHSHLDLAASGLGIITSANPASNNTANYNIASYNNTLLEGEFKKGRFSVNQSGNVMTEEIAPMNVISEKAQNYVPPTPSETRTNQMSRATSQDSLHERKSRFEVKHSGNHSPQMMAVGQPSDPPFQSLPITRENSNTSIVSRENSTKVSRFSIEKPDLVPSPLLEPSSATIANGMTAECRKKGRFELTGRSNSVVNEGNDDKLTISNDSTQLCSYSLESPQSTVAPSPAISPSGSISRGQAHRILDPSAPNMVYSHMEALLRQTEIQKNMLQDLMGVFPLICNSNNPNTINRTRTGSDSKKPPLPVEEPQQR
ncbi:kinase-like domain-containing protein [Pilobolus umbonatus]|nr:kinase-like domain-containing protein [Pilobolus umbonatus]